MGVLILGLLEEESVTVLDSRLFRVYRSLDEISLLFDKRSFKLLSKSDISKIFLTISPESMIFILLLF